MHSTYCSYIAFFINKYETEMEKFKNIRNITVFFTVTGEFY